jgi:hypothetical protein
VGASRGRIEPPFPSLSLGICAAIRGSNGWYVTNARDPRHDQLIEGIDNVVIMNQWTESERDSKKMLCAHLARCKVLLMREVKSSGTVARVAQGHPYVVVQVASLTHGFQIPTLLP